MLKCGFNSKQHLLVSPPLLSNIKRHAPDEVRGSLFMYWHLFEHTYVLAKWTGNGTFVDIYNFGSSLNNVTRHIYHTILANLHPAYVERCRREYILSLKGRDGSYQEEVNAVYAEKARTTKQMATWKSGWNGKITA